MDLEELLLFSVPSLAFLGIRVLKCFIKLSSREDELPSETPNNGVRVFKNLL